MEWWVSLLIIIGLLLGIFVSGLPIAFGFLLVNFIGVAFWMGGTHALNLVTVAVVPNIGSFTFMAVPLFMLLGSILFHTGVAGLMITAVGKWVGRIHGSLSLMAVGAGVVFGMMSGSSMSGVAVLGSSLIPEMRKRGYSKEMSIGPVLGAGGLAMIIPPSVLGVVLASMAKIPVGEFLIAGLVPGLVLAGLYTIYILLRGHLQPHLAPPFAPPSVTWGERAKSLTIIFPVGMIIFLVLGLIFLGVATPSEAAATGVFGAFLAALMYRQLNWQAIKVAVSEALMTTGMVFMILAGSFMFSSLLAYTGATAGLVAATTTLPVPPIVVVISMQILLMILGCFLDGTSIIMIAVPIYFPVVRALGFDPMWFGIMMLVNLEMGNISPPFGLMNFVMKAVVPDVSMKDIIFAGIPFFIMGVICILIILLLPPVVTWLPGLMMD